jgi:hypothetical protein
MLGVDEGVGLAIPCLSLTSTSDSLEMPHAVSPRFCGACEGLHSCNLRAARSDGTTLTLAMRRAACPPRDAPLSDELENYKNSTEPR